ncbi:hypothetical protein JCM11641_007034 [Rhodosporidiobolus odoratus]
MSSKAEQSKKAGNSAFAQQNYPLALAHYSTAIQLDPSVSTYPLNRAAVYLKLHNWTHAEKDAATALELDGRVNPKALFRRGLARKGLGNVRQAKADFEEAKKQGAGADVDKELAEVVALLAAQEKDNRPTKDGEKKTDDATKSSTGLPPSSAPAATKPASPPAKSSPSTERLKAALSSSSPQPPSAKPAAASSTDLLRPVSTRRLAPSSPTSPAVGTTIGDSPPPPAGSRPNSFAAKKSARDARTTATSRASPPPGASTPSSPAQAQTDSSAPPPLTAESPRILSPASAPPLPHAIAPIPAPTLPISAPSTSVAALLHPSSLPSPSPPKSPTALESLFSSHPPSSPTILSALRSLPCNPPLALRMWAGEGLTPDLLSSILAALSSHSLEGESGKAEREAEEWVWELVRALPGCKRWDSAVLFLGEEEKEIVKRVLGRKEKELEAVRKGWGL